MKVKVLQRIVRDLSAPGSYYEPGEVAELELPEATLSALIDYGIIAPVEPEGEPVAEETTQIILGDGVDDGEAKLAGQALQQRRAGKRYA